MMSLQLSGDRQTAVLLAVRYIDWRWRRLATGARTCRWYLNTVLPTETRRRIIAMAPTHPLRRR